VRESYHETSTNYDEIVRLDYYFLIYVLGPQGPGQMWMPKPQAPTNCPPGLEYMTQIDQLLVHQKVELLEGTYQA
jgi:hypothetical protein